MHNNRHKDVHTPIVTNEINKDSEILKMTLARNPCRRQVLQTHELSVWEDFNG